MNDQKLIDACNFIFELARDGLYCMSEEDIDPIKYCDSMNTIEEFLKSKGVDTYNIHKIDEGIR